MNKLQRNLVLISRLIVGLVFIYSGFVKGVDPLGSTYKFTDYFNAFHISWATGLAFGLGILLSTAEFVIGVAILLNLKPKLGTLGALLLMAVFTPLTFILALTNPVHDCGCFGDALILTNWQTFWKNIVIDIPIVYLFFIRKRLANQLSGYEQWAGVTFASAFIFLLSWYSVKHLPLLDFRPYKIGTYIPDGMAFPENAPADEWKSIFIYSKDGKEQEFGLNNLPDSTWAFVDSRHILVKKGYEPPIHDFTITNRDGEDFTDQLLSSSDYNVVAVYYNLEKADLKNQDQINQWADYCTANGMPFYALTASTDVAIEKFKNQSGSGFEFYATDEITLKTIIRANPGVLIIKDGTIVDKWNANDLPKIEELHPNLMHQSLLKYKKQADKYYIYTLILAGSLFIAIYLLIRMKWKPLSQNND